MLRENMNKIIPAYYDGKMWCSCRPGQRCKIECLKEGDPEDEDIAEEYEKDIKGG